MAYITIRYSKAGIMQYARFETDENHTFIISNTFACRYVHSSSPDFPKFKTGMKVVNVLKKLANFSFNKKAEIWSKSGILFDTNNYKDIEVTYIDRINAVIYSYIEEVIKPILPPECKIEYTEILVGDKNISDLDDYSYIYNKVNYLSYKLLYRLGVVRYNDFTPEVRLQQDYTSTLLSYLH